MKKIIRVIQRLDIKGPNVVKGIHLEGLRVVGKPEELAALYYENGADELIYIDAVASLYGRNSLIDIVEKTARKIFIPLTVGGGVRSIDDIKTLLRAGADKVAINTAAVHNPELIREAAVTFGSQCIVVSIQAKYISGKYVVFTDNGRERTDKEVFQWAEQAVALGAGEVLVTSIDREGTGSGYDVQLVHPLATTLNVPIIACGGCGSPGDMISVINEGRADAVCASSIFHYYYLNKQVNAADFKDEGNIEFIRGRRGQAQFMQDKLACMSIGEVKKQLIAAGIRCRVS